MEKMSFRQALLESLKDDTKRFQKKVRKNPPLPKGFKIKAIDKLWDDLEQSGKLISVLKVIYPETIIFKVDDVLSRANLIIKIDGLEANLSHNDFLSSYDFEYLLVSGDSAEDYTGIRLQREYNKEVSEFFEQHPEVAKEYDLDLRQYL